jgi:hypothetical protein
MHLQQQQAKASSSSSKGVEVRLVDSYQADLQQQQQQQGVSEKVAAAVAALVDPLFLQGSQVV